MQPRRWSVYNDDHNDNHALQPCRWSVYIDDHNNHVRPGPARMSDHHNIDIYLLQSTCPGMYDDDGDVASYYSDHYEHELWDSGCSVPHDKHNHIDDHLRPSSCGLSHDINDHFDHHMQPSFCPLPDYHDDNYLPRRRQLQSNDNHYIDLSPDCARMPADDLILDWPLRQRGGSTMHFDEHHAIIIRRWINNP